MEVSSPQATSATGPQRKPPHAGSRRVHRRRRPHPHYLAVRHDVFPGGCVTQQLRFRAGADPFLFASEASLALGYTSRDELRRTLQERSDGRLTLDPPVPG